MSTAMPDDVASIRDLFTLSRSMAGHRLAEQRWPNARRRRRGRRLDALSPEDAGGVDRNDLRPVLLSFQEEYEGPVCPRSLARRPVRGGSA